MSNKGDPCSKSSSRGRVYKNVFRGDIEFFLNHPEICLSVCLFPTSITCRYRHYTKRQVKRRTEYSENCTTLSLFMLFYLFIEWLAFPVKKSLSGERLSWLRVFEVFLSHNHNGQAGVFKQHLSPRSLVCEVLLILADSPQVVLSSVPYIYPAHKAANLTLEQRSTFKYATNASLQIRSYWACINIFHRRYITSAAETASLNSLRLNH
jgi:hypothetical protein